ncbi:MAG: ABC transporter ATP-binding protein [Flavobacteriia bacterium]|jgi:ABC-type Fe3+/spermidine/putrescine transport system ATPase subunit
MLSVKNISFSRDKAILDKISLSLKTGNFLGIVGPSGAGKSTLLKIIAGLLDADQGEVILDGEKILGPKDKLIPGNPNIQLVNQDFALDIYHTVYENLVVRTGHLSKEIREDFITELLDLTELTSLKTHKAHELSGGEQQRLALARALALEPKVILLDEPFSHLDAHIKRKISSYLLDLKRVRKTTFILVSHDGQEILHLCEQIAFFDKGNFQRVDSPENFYFEPKSYEEGLFFGELNRVKINRREILFRPNQFSFQVDTNKTELKISFKKKIFFGAFTMALYKYKQTSIYLQIENKINAEEINTIFV